MKSLRIRIFLFYCLSLLFINQCQIATARAEGKSITILHTNDLHSHFRGDLSPLKLGGVARLKTVIDQVRAQNRNTLLVDAGDWSEGNIYYNLGAGVESLKMMDHLGYDVAAVGNHDWLNGPDQLLNLFESVHPKTAFVAANLNSEQYGRSQEFQKWIPPYLVKNIGGVKIAWIGLSTYEFIFDQFFSPIQISEPIFKTRNLATYLKENHLADFVVVISHNSILMNQAILKAATDVDLMISGHQHKKLIAPIEVNQWGSKKAWLVEAGCWGRYLGKIDLKVENEKVALDQYRLIQIDSTIPEDPETLRKVDQLEERLENRYGPIFHQVIGESQVELGRNQVNNDMGNLVMDSYLNAVQADFALDSKQFIADGISVGPIRLVDAYNAYPSIYNPNTDQSWTLKKVPITGRVLKWFLYLLHTSKKVSSFGFISVSGLQFIYDPLFLMEQLESRIELQKTLLSPLQPSLVRTESIPVAKNIKIRGNPLDPDKTYWMVTGGGGVETIDFVNRNFYQAISLDQAQETGLESWKVLADYIQTISPITPSKVPRENRIQTLQPDLGVYPEDIHWTPIQKTQDGLKGKLTVTVKNYGASETSIESQTIEPTDPDSGYFEVITTHAAQIRVFWDKNGTNQSKEPDLLELVIPTPIRQLQPGESHVFSWEVSIPKKTKGPFSIQVQIRGDSQEINLTNNEATQWFLEP